MIHMIDIGDCEKHQDGECIEFMEVTVGKVRSEPRMFMVDYDEFDNVVAIHAPKGLCSSSNECLRFIINLINSVIEHRFFTITGHLASTISYNFNNRKAYNKLVMLKDQVKSEMKSELIKKMRGELFWNATI